MNNFTKALNQTSKEYKNIIIDRSRNFWNGLKRIIIEIIFYILVLTFGPIEFILMVINNYKLIKKNK